MSDFYRDLPFNYYASAECAVSRLRAANPVASCYPDLDRLLRSGEINNVVEFGCGAGWLTNTIAYHYRLPVEAVDFTTKAVQRARAVAQALNVADLVSITEMDLFDYTPQPADLVVSIGVLPCLHDPRSGFDHISQFVASGRHIYLGLYHEYGRRVFLDKFQKILQSGGEAAALAEFRRLSAGQFADETHLESWFRDQILHPHERLLTLAEVALWLVAADFVLRSTSINGFATFDRVETLWPIEKAYADLAYHAIYVEQRFFPGFFTVLAQKSR